MAFYNKLRQGKPLICEENIILNMFRKFSEKYPEVKIDDIMEVKSGFTDVSISAVSKTVPRNRKMNQVRQKLM